MKRHSTKAPCIPSKQMAHIHIMVDDGNYFCSTADINTVNDHNCHTIAQLADDHAVMCMDFQRLAAISSLASTPFTKRS